MRTSIAVLFLCISIIISYGQTPVDRVIEELEVLSNASFDNWKYTTDFNLNTQQISQREYNDSGWKNLRLNERIYPDSCWLRKIIQLPTYIAGEKVSGDMNLLLSVDDYGYLFVNGENKGHFPWDGQFSLTKHAQPGEEFVVVIKAINTGGPLRLIRARLDFERESVLKHKVDDFILSLRTGQKLLSFDTYQTNSRVKVDPGIDNSKMNVDEKKELAQLLNQTAEHIDIHSLRTGKGDTFLSSLEGVIEELKPVAEFAKRFTLHFTANAHIDAAWLWRKKETVEVCFNTFSSVMNMYRARPDEMGKRFAYAQSQAALYEWMVEKYPELFQQIKEKTQEGRWEIVGGMWVEPDCNLPDGVSWCRQLLYGQNFFKNHFGKYATLGWNPDSFGYNWNLPLFLNQSGIDVFITQKIGWNDTNVFPYRIFWWEAPDKSGVLTYFPFNYVNDISNPFRLIDWLRQFEANTGFTNMLVLFGIGNHGGGPSLEMMERIDRLRKVEIFPKIKYGTSDEYITWLQKQDLSQVPVWSDELYLEYHRGTFTTQSNTKKNNRECEVLLTNAEKFSSCAALYEGLYKQDLLNYAWKKVLFNQFHDILPGSSIREVYLDAELDYAQVRETGQFVLKDALQSLSEQINTAAVKNGTPLIVFNPLSWSRSDIVTIDLPRGESPFYEVYDLEGRKLDCQIQKKSPLKRQLVFYAENIPSLGYKTFKLMTVSEANPQAKQTVYQSEYLENELYKVTINPETGWIQSILDKQRNREILSAAGNELQVLEDKPSAWDAWNIGLTGVKYPTQCAGIELIENGPVRKVIRIRHEYLKPGTKKSAPTEDFPNSFFTQDVILYNDLDRIDFSIDIEWFESKTMLKVLFPLTVSDTIATYEIPYGTIKRSTTLKNQWDKGKWEVPALRWADLSEKNYGVSLLNKAKYGYDIHGSNMRLSLLRSPEWPDKTADRGFHLIEYALYPHAGDVVEAQTIRRGYEYNYPLIALIGKRHEGQLQPNFSFITLEPGNVILTSIKKAESNQSAYVVQMYETDGTDSVAELSFPLKAQKVFLSNFIEEEIKQLESDEKKVCVTLPAHGVVTLKIYF